MKKPGPAFCFQEMMENEQYFITFSNSVSFLEALHREIGCRGTAALVEVKGGFRVQSGLHCDVGIV